MDIKKDSDDNDENFICHKDQALQYYMKFGRERNLEKFLRLQHHVQSPCSFGMFEEQQPHCSTALTHTLQQLPLEVSDDDAEKTQNIVIEGISVEKLIPIEMEKSSEAETTQKSPTKSTQTDKENKDKPKTLNSTSSSDSSHSANLIRIFKESIEAEFTSKHKKLKDRTRDAKVSHQQEGKAETDDEIRTPKQRGKEKRQYKNTPESALRSHRRLEWDSLGDVGYRRSKSSSNISVLERLVLNQLLQDCGLNNASEKEKKFLERLLQPKDGKMLRAKSLDSPPLASSTHMSHSAIREAQQNISPEQIEKSVQTNISGSKKKSQQVQVDISRTPSSDNKSSKSSEEKLDSLEKLLQENDVNSHLNKLSTDSESSLEKLMTNFFNNSTTQITIDSTENSIKNSAQKNFPKSSSSEYDCVPVESLMESISTDSFQVIMKTKLPQEPKIIENTEKEIEQKSQKLDKMPNLTYERSQSLDEGSSKAYMFNKSKSCEKSNFQLEGFNHSITDTKSTKEEQEKVFKKFQKTLEKQLFDNQTRNSDVESKETRPRSRQSAQLDLGIQLLCELIEARSLNKSQKEKLLGDVVRRICNITGSEPPHHERLMAGEQTISQTTKSSGENSKEPKETLSSNAYASTSAAAAAKLALDAKVTHTDMSKDSNVNSDGLEKIEISQVTVQNNNKQITAKTTEESQRRNRTVESVASKSSTSTDHSVKMADKFTSMNSNNNHVNLELMCKPNWLNPMTHSEFEYEQRQAMFAVNADARNVIMQQSSLSDQSLGKRDVLINWLDMEINRLERLRQVMLNAKTVQSKSTSSTSTSKSREELLKVSKYKPIKVNVQEKEQTLYDQVVSENTISEQNSNKVDKRLQKPQKERTDYETNIIELVIEESKENMRVEKKTHDQIKYTQPAVKLGTLRERNNSLISTNSKHKKTPAEESSHSTTSSRAAEIVPAVQQRSKMATPTSSSQSYSMSSFEEKQKHLQLHTMATQTTGGAEQGTQTRPIPRICECIHTEMGKNNNYHYPYHACEHQRRRIDWQCCPNYTCNHAGMTTYYTTPMTQDDKYIKPNAMTTIIATATTTTTTTIKMTTPTTTTTTSSKINEAGIGVATKNTTTQIPSVAAASKNSRKIANGSRHKSSKSDSSLLTYTMNTHPQEKSSSLSSTTLPSVISSSSEVSIPMGSNGNVSSSITTTTHQYDDLDSIERQPLRQNIAVQTSSTLLLEQIPEEVAPGLKSAPLRMKPKSIAYVLEFSTNNTKRRIWKYKSSSVDETKKEEEPKSEEDDPRQRMTLQAHLERARPSFVAHTKERKALLNKLQMLRQQREKELREIIENTSFNSIERKLSQIPPPAIDQVRVFSTVQMKALTRKRARKLPEVLDREHREREERRRRGNRLLKDLFNRRLQKRVRIGQISLNHSKTVI